MSVQGHKPSHLFITITAFVVALFAIVATDSTATAAPRPEAEWLKWELQTDFISGNVQTNLIVKLGYTNHNNQDIVLETNSEYLDCYIAGNSKGVQIGHGEAQFDGSGYIVCDMPGIHELYRDMQYGRGLTLYPTANVRSADTWIELNLYGDDITDPNPMPLFHHPNIQAQLTKSAAAQWSLSLTANSEQNKMETTQKPFAPQNGQPNFLSARIYQCNTLHDWCTGEQTVNRETTTNGVLRAQNNPWLNHMDPTPIYIGFSPDTGKTFTGTIINMRIDPPNRIVSG